MEIQNAAPSLAQQSAKLIATVILKKIEASRNSRSNGAVTDQSA
jgi:hypothetical protein